MFMSIYNLLHLGARGLFIFFGGHPEQFKSKNLSKSDSIKGGEGGLDLIVDKNLSLTLENKRSC